MFEGLDDSFEDSAVYDEAARQHAIWQHYRWREDEAADSALDRKLTALRDDLERRQLAEAEAAFVARMNAAPTLAERVAARFMAWVNGVRR